MKTNRKSKFHVYVLLFYCIFSLLAFKSMKSQSLNKPESIVFNNTDNSYLISNYGNGKIIRMMPNGDLSVFVSGLTSPAGMIIVDNSLFVNDNTRIKGFDLTSGNEIMNLIINSNSFLNDITADYNGNLFVTDMALGKIYKVNISAGSFSVFANTGISGLNGIFYDEKNQRLLCGSTTSASTPIITISLVDTIISQMSNTSRTSGYDGITMDTLGNVYASNWETGNVYKFNSELNDAGIIVSSGHDGPADIFYNTHTDTLAIPNMNGNRIDFVRIFTPQQTGSFETNINFYEEQRTLALYVPSSYDPFISYKLIAGLHYCGGTPQEYRDFLKNLSDILDAIIMCPDAGNSSTTYLMTNPKIIPASIDSVKAVYNIDNDYIYLTGGSCNGQETFYYGLDSIYDFRGIIPFNAWLPDITSRDYNFDSDMPTCICSGTEDSNYSNNVLFYEKMEEKGRRVLLNSMPGIGHDFGFSTMDAEMIECINFIDSIALTEPITTFIESLPATGNYNIIVYPNPFKEKINIKIELSKADKVTLELYDLNGRKIKIQTFGRIDAGIYDLFLNLDNVKLTSGFYLLRFIIGSEIIHKKIISQ